ncbi:festuclavine dehydrogenase subunit FgaOx3 [Aspergillus udagawae]|uniref:Festuclavine dehydrogenase subunit FgaOx3 n=1 Tax=Aspergillus udagawae TaxID=91492 RepID=A0ABQ1ATC2_9EURO|nr:festuclavine dehydrogenase subunit FgaOx3 [Aspergillus udagawae]
MAPLTRLRADSRNVAHRRSNTDLAFCRGGLPHGPGTWSEEQVQAWKKVTDAVHEKGSFIFCQLIALGRAADPAQLHEEGGYELHAPSPIPIEPGMPVPAELDERRIQGIIRDFATAARNAIRAGFDGVEIHGTNGYLVDQFIQDVSNCRNGQWGGDIPIRARFALEVARTVPMSLVRSGSGFV